MAMQRRKLTFIFAGFWIALTIAVSLLWRLESVPTLYIRIDVGVAIILSGVLLFLIASLRLFTRAILSRLSKAEARIQELEGLLRAAETRIQGLEAGIQKAEQKDKEYLDYIDSLEHDVIRASHKRLSPKLDNLDDLVKPHIDSAVKARAVGYLYSLRLDVRHLREAEMNIQAWERMQEKDIRAAFEFININELLQQVLQRVLESHLPDESAILEGCIDLILTPRHPSVQGDKGLLQSAFYNLIDNAIKYSRRNKTQHVNVTSGISGNDEWVIIDLADNGIGIPSTQLDVFRRGVRRVRGTNVGDIGGTGLGLWLAKSIVELHGGYMEITSQEHIETKVIVYLPKV
jgi:signal transduction histidine kinase